ncbi:MAG TPA: DUF309 domain-containing protein [Chloroflexota bacterium]|jgi:hypothetical protein
MAESGRVTGRSCADAPPPELAVAVEQFNRGEFFECHETLEALWLAEGEPLRRLYQGILQVGVAFHHQRRGNYRGAMHLLRSGIAHLLPFAPRCLGVDVEGLLAAAVRCRDTLVALGPERIDQLDPALVPRITLLGRPPP